MDSGACSLRVRHDLVTKQEQQYISVIYLWFSGHTESFLYFQK